MLTSTNVGRDVTVTSRDGTLLRARWWTVDAPRGMVIVVHGLGEHGGAYASLAEAVGGAIDVDILAPDLRGHGRSQGRRGVVRNYDELVDDLRAVVGWARDRRPELPLFVLGHSNGGQVALRLALDAPGRIAGVVVSNPAIRVAIPVPRFKLWVGRFLETFLPWLTLRSDVRPDLMTRDPEIQATYACDELRHNRISAPLYFGMVEGGEMLLARANELRLPLLMIIGGQDPVICPSSNREFFDRAGSLDKLLLFYPKMLHEPFNEVGRELVFSDLIRWLDPRLSRVDPA